MKTFISYVAHAEQKRLAGQIKKFLDKYGFNCFLAHDDIPPQSHWPKNLQKNLDECDLFVALLTRDYNKSFYCQQELGYAFCKKAEILPVLISVTPVGIIYDLQGIHFNPETFVTSCRKIVKHVATIESLSEPVINGLINEFGESDSFDQAGRRAKRLLKQSGLTFTRKQARKIMERILANRQIAGSRTANPHIRDFIEKYRRYLESQMIKRYEHY
jgi:hypothetical protein